MRNRLVILNEKSGKSSAFKTILEQIGRDESTQILRLTREVNLNEAVRKAVVDGCDRLIRVQLVFAIGLLAQDLVAAFH